MKSRVVVVTAVLSVGVAGVLVAQSDRFKVFLRGYEEVPSVSTTGRGSFEARINDAETEIWYRLSYSELEGQVTQAHIHFSQRRTNGGISAWLCGNPPVVAPPPDTPLCPPPPATVTGIITASDVVGPTSQGIEPGRLDELIKAIRAGVTYANVHSNRFPGGEIRAQIHEQDHGRRRDRDSDSDDR